MANGTADTSLLELATELTMAWLSNPNTRASAEEVPTFLQSMHGAVTTLAAGPAAQEEAAPAAEFVPAVSVRRSLASKDHIVSLIDGKPYKTLKRHLAGHGLTPAEYRARYGLKADYPMVAESYAEMRRGLAKTIGLGRKPGTKVIAGKAAAKPVEAKVAEVKPLEVTPAAKSAAAKSATKPEVTGAKTAAKPAAVKAARPQAKAAKAKAKPVAAKVAAKPEAKAPDSDAKAAAAIPAEVNAAPKAAMAKTATKTAALKATAKPDAKAAKPKTQRRARTAAPETAPQS